MRTACGYNLGDEVRFHAAGLCGPGETAYEQTLGMFALAEDLLQKAGMEFRDVVRTWIYMRDIDRDYADLNRARREFFAARGIDPAPASTGIGGGPVSEAHDLCLGVYAVKAGRPVVRTVMTSPTLNEAVQYGADFVRGMKVVETNKVALHVSGTASIDEHGRTAHVGDFEAQADRMLVNIAALLEGQGANFGNVVSAITYLKHPADAERLREKLHAAGFEGFPHALGRGADLPARPALRNGGAGGVADQLTASVFAPQVRPHSAEDLLPPAATIPRLREGVLQVVRRNTGQGPTGEGRDCARTADRAEIVGVEDLHEAGPLVIVGVDDAAVVFPVFVQQQLLDLGQEPFKLLS